MTTVTEQLDLPGLPDASIPLPGAARVTLQIRLAGTGGELVVGYTNAGATIVADRDIYADVNGRWSVELVPNSQIVPAGTVYRLDYAPILAREPIYISVPVSGSHNVAALLVDPPGELESAALGQYIRSQGFTHDWTLDGGWSQFQTVLINEDPGGAQTFELIVTGVGATGTAGVGAIVGTQPTFGNKRVAYAYLPAGRMADAEMTSLIYGPVGGVGFNLNAQQGHLHRMRQLPDGSWEAIAFWTAVFAGDYSAINFRAVRLGGADLLQSIGDTAKSSDSTYLDRTLRLVSKNRFTFFGGWINEHTVIPHYHGFQVGDVFNIDSLDSTFDATSVALSGASPGNIQHIETVTVSGSPHAFDMGTAVPVAASQKRWVPYWLSTRIRGGTSSAIVGEFKRWRVDEAEPDWSDRRVVRMLAQAGPNVPTVATEPGFCGLWAAHFVGGSAGGYGPVRVKPV